MKQDTCSDPAWQLLICTFFISSHMNCHVCRTVLLLLFIICSREFLQQNCPMCIYILHPEVLGWDFVSAIMTIIFMRSSIEHASNETAPQPVVQGTLLEAGWFFQQMCPHRLQLFRAVSALPFNLYRFNNL